MCWLTRGSMSSPASSVSSTRCVCSAGTALRWPSQTWLSTQAAESRTARLEPSSTSEQSIGAASATMGAMKAGSGPRMRQPKIISEASCRCQLPLPMFSDTNGHTIGTTSTRQSLVAAPPLPISSQNAPRHVAAAIGGVIVSPSSSSCFVIVMHSVATKSPPNRAQ